MTFVLGGTEYTLTSEHYVRKVRKVICLSVSLLQVDFPNGTQTLKSFDICLVDPCTCFYALSDALCVLFLRPERNNISLS